MNVISTFLNQSVSMGINLRAQFSILIGQFKIQAGLPLGTINMQHQSQRTLGGS